MARVRNFPVIYLDAGTLLAGAIDQQHPVRVIFIGRQESIARSTRLERVPERLGNLITFGERSD